MNNPYILPICFAAAAHGALLFGFTKTPAPVKQPPEQKHYTRFVIPPDLDPPAIVEFDAGATKSKPLIDVPAPTRGPEPTITKTASPFTITPPPFSPVGSDDVRRILDASEGVVGGIGDTLSKTRVVGREFLDNAPRTRFQASPLYPFQGKKEGMSGEVWVDFTVDEQGRVLDPRVVKSSHAMFDEPTLRAVSKWQFEPGRRNGRIVKFRMTVPVVFNLNEGS